jgi:protein-L-isoaspartate(D-aspartate) O-methyltransferase
MGRAPRGRGKGWPIVLAFFAISSLALATTEDEYRARRQSLMREIEFDVRATSEYIGRQELDKRVMEVMARVPRHEFVPQSQKPYAYQNRPLPIGHGQTISQPYIVALMTDLMKVGKDDVVLEVGTGSGYQAAILGELAKKAYTIEIIPELAKSATERLRRLGFSNVTTRTGDGYYGWKEAGPFDGIMVTAAASQIPPPLVKQLKPGGRMVIPVGSPFLTQHLMLVEKDAQGQIKTRQILPVRFVPLTGKH